MHWMAWALDFALVREGSSKPARMAIMAITTNNSIKVKAPGRRRWWLHTGQSVPVLRRIAGCIISCSGRASILLAARRRRVGARLGLVVRAAVWRGLVRAAGT